jgi:hypothetical protein
MKPSSGFSTAKGGLQRCSAFIAHCDACSLTAIGPRGGSVHLTTPLMEPAALDLMLADGLSAMQRVKAYLDAEIAS